MVASERIIRPCGGCWYGEVRMKVCSTNAQPTRVRHSDFHGRFRRPERQPRRSSMPTSVKQLMEAANAVVPKITPAQAREMIGKGNTLVVDVRDASELEKSGKVAGAVHHSRGMLEFRADPDSPYHDENFARDKTIILYCASGGRSALAGKVLKEMGYDQVYNMGSFKDWVDSGGAIE